MADGTTSPAACVRALGRGKIAATAFTFGQGYAQTRDAVMRRFLNELAKELFPNPMVEVKGSSDVDVVVGRQGQRLTVSLINTSGPHQSAPVIDEVSPVGPINLTIRQAARPAKVTLEPAGISLPFEYANGAIRVTVPRVEIHEIVVVENN